MLGRLRESWRFIREAPAGERFERFHERRQRRRRSPARRVLLLGAGLAVVAVGVVLMPAPGPGMLIVAVGAGTMAGESRGVARLLDALERGGRRAWARWRG